MKLALALAAAAAVCLSGAGLAAAQGPGTADAGTDRPERIVERTAMHSRLLLQEAERRGLSVTERELDAAVTALRGRFEDLAGLGAWMKQRGLDDRSLLVTLRAEMLVAKVSGALVGSVRVTDEQARQYYEAHAGEFRRQEVRIQVIVVEDETAAAAVQAALRGGEDFGRVAQDRSRGRRAARGGDVGWVEAASLWPPMRQALARLQPGEAIGPLSRGEELLVVRLHKRRPGRAQTLAEARPEIERRLLPGLQQAAIHAWLTEQEKTLRIEALPREPIEGGT